MATRNQNTTHITTAHEAGARIICFPGVSHPAANAVTTYTTLNVVTTRLEEAVANFHRKNNAHTAFQTDATESELVDACGLCEEAVGAVLQYRCRTDAERGQKARLMWNSRWFDAAEITAEQRLAALA